MKFELLHGTLYIDGNEPLVGDKIVQSCIDDGAELFIKSTNVAGIYFYGLKQLKDSKEHPAGYVWESRASVMNKVMNLRLVDAFYKIGASLTCCAIDLDVFEKFLELDNIFVDSTVSEDDEDRIYRVIKEVR